MATKVTCMDNFHCRNHKKAIKTQKVVGLVQKAFNFYSKCLPKQNRKFVSQKYDNSTKNTKTHICVALCN